MPPIIPAFLIIACCAYFVMGENKLQLWTTISAFLIVVILFLSNVTIDEITIGIMYIRMIGPIICSFILIPIAMFLLGSLSADRSKSDYDIEKYRPLTIYQRYMKSPEWKAKRKIVLKRDSYTCQKCGVRSYKGLHVHHIRYPEVLGTEPDEWLITLCPICHRAAHRYKKRGASNQCVAMIHSG